MNPRDRMTILRSNNLICLSCAIDPRCEEMKKKLAAKEKFRNLVLQICEFVEIAIATWSILIITKTKCIYGSNTSKFPGLSKPFTLFCTDISDTIGEYWT